MDAAATRIRDARLTWMVSGTLLIIHSVVTLAANAVTMLIPIPGTGIALNLIWAAALLVFAFGIRRSGSVVARRPLGVAALIVAALLPFASILLWRLITLDATDQMVSVAIGETFRVLSLAALLVATVAIARAGVVPARVRWVPLIVLSVVAGMQVLAEIVAVSTPVFGQQAAAIAALFGTSLVGSLGILLLGVLAILFAPREPTDAVVQVYPPE